jgi:hypothetical protein
MLANTVRPTKVDAVVGSRESGAPARPTVILPPDPPLAPEPPPAPVLGAVHAARIVAIGTATAKAVTR